MRSATGGTIHRPETVETPEVTVQNGKRASAATQYLHPAMKRPNLSVMTGGMVTRVVIGVVPGSARL